jgi:hypothetical protein
MLCGSPRSRTRYGETVVQIVQAEQANCFGDNRDEHLRWKFGAWSA